MVAEIEEPKEEKKSCVGLKKIHSHPTYSNRIGMNFEKLLIISGDGLW